MRHRRGFTLIELMIVVLVVAVLASIALSGYNNQVRKSRRSEAKQVLSDLGLKQEKYRSNNTTYGTIIQIGGVATAKYYTVTMVASSKTGTNYTFTAEPIGDQTKDSCGILTLKMLTGVLVKEPTTDGCW